MNTHRWVGKIYILSVLTSGSAGLIIAYYATGGVICKFGFGALAIIWIITDLIAHTSIRRGDIVGHEKWMIRNYARTFAAVSLRLWLPLMTSAMHMDFIFSYRIVSWLCWIPNQDFLSALNTSKILSQRLLKLLSHEFTVFVNSVSLFAQRTVRERLATQLVVMREKYKENFRPGMDVEINLSREDLASIVGTARENVVRLLKEFKEDKSTETRGRKIIVKDVHKLLKIANQSI